MPSRHLLAIPLPHGRDNQTGLLTVYFAPRLRERGPLSDYPEWEHWADTVNALTINVEVDGAVRPSTRVTPLAEPAAWQAVFADDTPVSGYRPTDWRALARDRLQVGPGGDFSEAILRLYASFAINYPAAPPAGDDALEMPEAVDVFTSAQLDTVRDYVTPMSDSDGERLAAARDPDWDFHRYVSILGHHPHLLRLLGLAVELEVSLPVGIPAAVRVHTNYDNGSDRHGVDFVMRTTPDFWAAPNPDPLFTEQDGGLLRLAEQKAFLSILDLQSSADRLHGLDDRLPGHEGSLPALRTRALTLVRPDLVTAFRNRTERQWEIEEQIHDALKVLVAQRPPVPIFAEDVTIGHRIDVFEPDVEESAWRSLFQRQTDPDGYRFPRDATLDRIPEPDEGWTTTTLATELVETRGEPDSDPNPDVPTPDVEDAFEPYARRRLDDQLYRWDGWSGAVRPPGSAADGATGQKAPDQPAEPAPDDPVQFAAHYDVVPGSLPRLRFGHTYLMRARCVDLAGDSRPLDAPTPPSALPPAETFGRLEPIAAPFFVRRRPRPVPGVGDEARTIVLHSDYDVYDVTVRPSERLLFPGQVGQDLCELHSVPHGGVDPDSYRLLRVRDARDPANPWEPDPVTGEPIAAGRRRQPVRYLSDPLIGRLRAHHHGTGEEHLAALATSWPAVTSARLEVVAGETAVVTNPDDATTLQIAVPKAEITTVDLSYALAEGGIEQFGLWHQLDTSAQDALRERIETGGHWMFSARAPVKVVHAVRRPLLAPRIAPTGDEGAAPDWSAARAEGSTGVTISATLEIDRRSTGRVTMAARWTDLVDDVRRLGPEPRTGGASLGNFLTPRDPAAAPRFTIAGHRAELGDTRRHAARIELEAFSSFSDYFTAERTVTLGGEPVVVDPRGFAAGTVTVRADPGGVAASEGADFVVDHPLGTVAVVDGGALEEGDEVTVRYVPLPVSRTNTDPDEAIPPFEVVFPSTAVPPPPQVVDVVSAAARVSTEVDGGADVLHDGRVVRLYLARPWNATGDGEALAVLVEKAPGAVPSASCLGRDPIVTGGASPLTAESLTRSFTVVDSFDGVHVLALHTASYDLRSQRWFADIAVDTEVYRPFLRLVVARYQADSLPGLELSSPVTLEPIRLGVSRLVTVRPVADGAGSFDVTVTGPDHGGFAADDGDGGLLANELAAVHQQADPAIADVDLRWQVDVARVELERTSSGETSTWSGTIDAPIATVPRRLLIEEREPALVGGAVAIVTGEIVYADAITLPEALAP